MEEHTLLINLLTPRFVPLVAAFVDELNQQAAHRLDCCNQPAGDLARTLMDMLPLEQQATFLVARAADGLVGFIGYYQPEPAGPAALWGPYVRHPQWAAVADLLWLSLANHLPKQVRRLELRLPPSNRRVVAFAREHGFQPAGDCFRLNR